MTEFVNGFLNDTGVKCLMDGYRGKTFIEPAGGDDAGPPVQLGLSIYIGQDRNEQIDLGYGDHFYGVNGCKLGQAFQNHSGIVLVPNRIQGKVRIIEKRDDLCPESEHAMYVSKNLFKEGFVQFTNRRDSNDMFR